MRARTYYTKFCFLTAQPLTDNVTESKLRKNRNSASIEHQRQTLTHMHKSAALIIVLCHTNSFLHVVCVLNARILNHHTEFMQTNLNNLLFLFVFVDRFVWQKETKTNICNQEFYFYVNRLITRPFVLVLRRIQFVQRRKTK